jgi:hypothetical protein
VDEVRNDASQFVVLPKRPDRRSHDGQVDQAGIPPEFLAGGYRTAVAGQVKGHECQVGRVVLGDEHAVAYVVSALYLPTVGSEADSKLLDELLVVINHEHLGHVSVPPCDSAAASSNERTTAPRALGL